MSGIAEGLGASDSFLHRDLDRRAMLHAVETFAIAFLVIAIAGTVLALAVWGVYEWRQSRKRSAQLNLPAPPPSGWGYVVGGACLAWAGLGAVYSAESDESIWVGFAALWLGSVLGVAGVVAIG